MRRVYKNSRRDGSVLAMEDGVQTVKMIKANTKDTKRKKRETPIKLRESVRDAGKKISVQKQSFNNGMGGQTAHGGKKARGTRKNDR